MRALAAAALALAAIGCYHPQITDGALLCAADNKCPQGMHCGCDGACYHAGKDPASNTLTVVQGHDHPLLRKTRLEAGDASWIAGAAPAAANGDLAAKTRYRQADSACRFTRTGGESFALDFLEPQWAVTPGQSAVLYRGELCLGGGIIS